MPSINGATYNDSAKNWWKTWARLLDSATGSKNPEWKPAGASWNQSYFEGKRGPSVLNTV